MTAKRSNFWTPLVTLAVVASLIVIGNLRAPVAAATTEPAPGDVASTVAASPQHGRGDDAPAGRESPSGMPALESMVGADVDEPVGEEGALVPALYAWNPDVRFVYFRQISKWM